MKQKKKNEDSDELVGAYEMKVKKIETTLRGKSNLQACWEIKLCRHLFPNTGYEITSFVNADELNWIGLMRIQH